MFGIQLAELLGQEPDGVDAAMAVVTGCDEALVEGFARLGADRAAALTALAGAVAASPLGPAVAEAVEKTAAGSATDEHLAAVAGARTALLGAVHDARLASLDAALGRAREPWPEAADGARLAEPRLAGARSWLRELALVGWRGVGDDLVSSVDPLVEALWDEPATRRLAVLVDGLAAELHALGPLATAERLPVRRWSDLWSRALLLSQPGPWAPDDAEAAPVTGRLLPLGTEIHEHGTSVQVVVHALLEQGGEAPTRLVRVGVGAAKVDTIVGPAVWRVLHRHPVLLGALAERRALEIAEMPLHAGGDLRWHDDRARPGEPADPFVTARAGLPDALAAPVPPLDRHPVRLAEPVLLEGYTVKGDTLHLDGHALPLALDQLPSSGPLTRQLVGASSEVIGLLGWDRGWTLRPLAVRATVKRQRVEAHNGDWALGPTDPKIAKAEARTGDAVAVLRERAGRLLRS
ncbi:hypothetical protein [Streptomyces profundus]|uniref:hypothetical protein n=1 Tax=Streptomyces profundus TaxID=2867410 RepID=UPI001D163013|nr:hypothetical protein [Streptomyces sp. MA3_2.13]UED87771.1 hypothetical protein K4G22_29200 [Streptomyces sp. MA3_2.13]